MRLIFICSAKAKNQLLTELHAKLIKNYIAHNIYCYFLNYFLFFCKNAVKIAVCSTDKQVLFVVMRFLFSLFALTYNKFEKIKQNLNFLFSAKPTDIMLSLHPSNFAMSKTKKRDLNIFIVET